MRSLWAGPVAWRRGRRVTCRRLTALRCGLAASALALGARRGAFLPRRDAQPLDAARIGIEHLDLVIAGARDHLAAHRQAPDEADEIAAQRLDFLAGLAGDEVRADHGADVVEAG